MRLSCHCGSDGCANPVCRSDGTERALDLWPTCERVGVNQVHEYFLRIHRGLVTRCDLRKWLSKLVEPRWIIDQNLPALRFTGNPGLQQITYVSIIGHRRFDMDMRPVGAPDDLLRGRGNKRARKDVSICMRKRQPRYPVCSGQL